MIFEKLSQHLKIIFSSFFMYLLFPHNDINLKICNDKEV